MNTFSDKDFIYTKKTVKFLTNQWIENKNRQK